MYKTPGLVGDPENYKLPELKVNHVGNELAVSAIVAAYVKVVTVPG